MPSSNYNLNEIKINQSINDQTNRREETQVKQLTQNDVNEVIINNAPISITNLDDQITGELPTIKIKIGQNLYTLLLDSGSSITCLSHLVFEKIKLTEKVNLIAKKIRVTTLNNTEIFFTGCAEIYFMIGEVKHKHTFFITKEHFTREYVGIIGFDLIKRFNTKINIPKGYFKFEHSKVPIVFTKSSAENNLLEINEAALVRKQIILPNQKVWAKLRCMNHINNETILFEPKSLKQEVIITPTVTQAVNGEFQVVIENVTEKEIMLNKSMKLGMINDFIIEDTGFNHQINYIKASKDILDLRAKEFDLNDFNLNHLEEEIKQPLKNLFQEYKTIFSKTLKTLGKTDVIEPRIQLTSQIPKFALPYPIPYALHETVKKQLNELLEADIIEPSNSLWAAPMLLVKKKAQNEEIKYRLALDARLINNVTIPQPIEFQNIREVINKLCGKKYFTKLDFKSAFHQIILPPEDRQYFAFLSILGHFQFKRVIFGAKNSTAIFVKLMQTIFKENDDNILFYLDDLILTTDTVAEMFDTIKRVFEILKTYNLTLGPEKCEFLKTEIDYLGYRVTTEGIYPNEDNIKKINCFPEIKTVRQLKKLLGLLNYYRSSVKNFAKIVAPLENASTKRKLHLTPECKTAIENIKDIFMSKPFLIIPDTTQKFYLQTDASKTGIGGALLQKRDGELRVCFYFSKKLKPAETRYSATKLEALAIISAVRHFRQYLYGRKFKIISDHKSLLYHLKVKDNPPSQLVRWMIELSEYDFDFMYLEGHKNVLPDFLSRIYEDDADVIRQDRIQINNLALIEPLTNEEILEQQTNDLVIQELRNNIVQNNGTYKKRNGESYFIHKQSKLVCMMRITFRNGKSQENINIVIPKKLQKKAILEIHCTHLGVSKTYELLRRKYYWIGCYNDINNFIKSCEICNRVKISHQVRKPIGKTIVASKPGEVLFVDFVYFTEANKYGLTIIDSFSRYLHIYVVNNMSAETTAQKLVQYYCDFSKPRIIYTDLGRNFTSQIFKEMNRIFQIKLLNGLAYSPFMTGYIERSHLSLKDTLRCLKQTGKNLELAVQLHQAIYNNTQHRISGFEPNYLFFGRQTDMLFDYTRLSEINNPEFTEEKYLHTLKEELRKAYLLAMQNTMRSRDRQINIDINKQKGATIKEGMTVYIKKCNKFAKTSYEGPYLIKKVLSKTVVLVINPRDNSEMRISISKLKTAPERNSHLI